MASKIMAAAAKVLVVAAGSWPGLQRPRFWVVAATEAAATELLAAAAKVVVVAVKVMPMGRVVAAAAVASKVVAGWSRLQPWRPWLWPQRPRYCPWSRGCGSNRGPGRPGGVTTARAALRPLY